ncbi:hypothetical protein BDZ97DRAFT_1920144 [Flammula alnicola]|nr:hypothetical protein BDZ97DRAFT_1920144 [Flammula alnicola]
MRSCIPQEIIDLIIDELGCQILEKNIFQTLALCSLVSRAFQRRPQSYIFSEVQLDTNSRISHAVEFLPLLKCNPRLRSYVKVLELILGDRPPALTSSQANTISNILDMLGRNEDEYVGVNTLKLFGSGIDWPLISENIRSSFCILLLGQPADSPPDSRGVGRSRGGVQKVYLSHISFPLELLSLCPSLDELELDECHKTEGPDSTFQQSSTIHFSVDPMPRPRVKLFRLKTGDIFLFLQALEADDTIRILSEIKNLYIIHTEQSYPPEDMQYLAKFISRNANHLESISLNDDLTDSLYDELVSVLPGPINLTLLPHLRSFSIARTVMMPAGSTFSPVANILNLFDPYPHDDAPISLEEVNLSIDIDIVEIVDAFDFLSDHHGWDQLDATLTGPRFRALRAVELKIRFMVYASLSTAVMSSLEDVAEEYFCRKFPLLFSSDVYFILGPVTVHDLT